MMGTGGGSATAGGMDYQHRVAAWVAVRILAESEAPSLWRLPASATLQWLRCETDQPVDDLMMGTSTDGCMFVQAKHRVDLSSSPTSHLGMALEQFVRQVSVCQAVSGGQQPWERPLDPERDRLVLTVGPDSSGPARVDLPSLLDRLRVRPENQARTRAAANEREARALKVITAHVRRSWRKVFGRFPTRHELRALLALIHVECLRVDTGGTDERDARHILARSILRDPGQVDAAWALLITTCARFAVGRGGADRYQLQRILLDAGMEVQAVRSYREDIERLRAHSGKALTALGHLARIQVGSAKIKIARKSTEELRRAAEESSLLVIGAPGTGKSGAVHDMVETLSQWGRDVVLLAVEQLAAQSVGELREELSLEHDLPDVLANWPGARPAFLVVDALDAARDDRAAGAAHELIRLVEEEDGRWHVVASVRKFDLRYSPKLRQMFAGAPPTDFRDEEFLGIRHVCIPGLSEEELSLIATQSPELGKFVAEAPAELRELMRVPFNLRLVGELLAAGMPAAGLGPIRTQLELLDRYWLWRVIGPDGGKGGDAREKVLRQACEAMVGTRTLRADRRRLDGGVGEDALHDLLSRQVLMEWQPSRSVPPERYVIVFGHHVVFDYATERLLLRGDPVELIHRLEVDPDLALVIRPSLVLHFRQLWLHEDQERFWDLVLRVMRAEGIPEIGKLIGPAVAAEEARKPAELEPLLRALEGGDLNLRTAATSALRHLVGALLAVGPAETTLVGPRGGPWCQLAERVTRNLRRDLAYALKPLIASLCDHPEDFTPEQLVAAGRAARRFLEYAWQATPRDPWMAILALQSVCRTYESDHTASQTVLRVALTPEHLANYGFEELPWLAREVKRLVRIDPVFVEEVYCTAFAHRERSEAPTEMLGSRILPLVSNRQQDYGMALYTLGETFPEFVAHAPLRALRALIVALEAYVAERHPSRASEPAEEFEFRGRVAKIGRDYSAIWDTAGAYRHDEPLKMLDAMEHHLERLGGQENGVSQLHELVEVIVASNRLAVLWARLLRLGARSPGTVGREILPLSWTPPILTGFDTSTVAGEFLRAIYPELGPDSRERIERAILAIPSQVPADRREAGEGVRNRLLGCLAEDRLVTDEARELVVPLMVGGTAPPVEPPGEFEYAGTPYTEEHDLAREGVPVDVEANRRIRGRERPVKEFAGRHLNSAPNAEEIDSILPALEALWEALLRSDVDGVHPRQRDYAWDSLAAASARIARVNGLSCEDRAGALVRKVLLEACRNQQPVPRPEADADPDKPPSWSSPAARVEAADGVVLLTGHPTCACVNLVKAVGRLAADPVPAVRFQVARHLRTLNRAARDEMWRIIDRMCQEEGSLAVLQALLGGTLLPLAGSNPDRVAVLAKTVFDRGRKDPGAEHVREGCLDVFRWLYIWQDHVFCREVLSTIVASPAENSAELRHVLSRLRSLLTYGPLEPPDPRQEAIRQRALKLVGGIVESVRDGLRTIEAASPSIAFSEWPPQAQERMRALAHLAHHLGTEIYFASGAFDHSREAGEPRLTEEERARFYREVGWMLDELADLGFPSLAHHLVETLETLVAFDPRGVFLRVGRVIQKGRRGGYEYESLAVDLIVKLVERYLAEYRPLFREDEQCRQTLRETLDAFVQAGWPRARRLTYRLEEIFR